MASLFDLVHAPRWRPRWRALLAVLVLVTAGFAFTPDPQPEPAHGMDKLRHSAAFSALAAVAALGGPAGGAAAWRVMAAALGYGGFIELAQTQIPGRSAEWGDLAADLVGAALGLGVAAALRRAIRPRV